MTVGATQTGFGVFFSFSGEASRVEGEPGGMGHECDQGTQCEMHK